MNRQTADELEVSARVFLAELERDHWSIQKAIISCNEWDIHASAVVVLPRVARLARGHELPWRLTDVGEGLTVQHAVVAGVYALERRHSGRGPHSSVM